MLAVLGNKHNEILSNEADTLAWVMIIVGVKPALVVVPAIHCSCFLDQVLYNSTIITIADSKSIRWISQFHFTDETKAQGS